ncbi:hypothetical protein [Virgibacillus sediminis]|uniref:Permease n=1 Tax=Virgibacillus sediminis TaxID=202260 RepID=A0ABV7A1W4_9BACI
MRNFVIGGAILLGLFIILPFFNIDSSLLFVVLSEWITKFVLSWIALYWLIRGVKALENKLNNSY